MHFLAPAHLGARRTRVEGRAAAFAALARERGAHRRENGGAGTHACGNGELCIWDNSSPSFAPTGLQSNGTTLTPVAFHGTVADAFDNAAVSSTIGSVTFGTCGGAGQPPCTVAEPGTLAAFGIGLGAFGLIARRRRKTALTRA